MPERERKAARPRKPEVEAIEEKLEGVRNLVLRCATGLLGREAVEHLVNARKELLLAVRSIIDARIQRLEEATQRLRKVEIEGEEG
ncbi:MAG: hypothetical protein RMK18_05240 [Armatimonadota bacterium]|nr:hypothetical protein [Armatimonadota bacterium]MCX7776601.1 hypothetical protein [Armatimonadota bacterium]MDW8025256.1 hypothetical protein [Armatimonadota bacterium]